MKTGGAGGGGGVGLGGTGNISLQRCNSWLAEMGVGNGVGFFLDAFRSDLNKATMSREGCRSQINGPPGLDSKMMPFFVCLIRVFPFGMLHKRNWVTYLHSR